MPPINAPSQENTVVTGPTLQIEGPLSSLSESIRGGGWDAFRESVSFWWDVYSIIALLLSLIFFIGFVYAKIKFNELADIETAALRKAEADWAAQHTQAKSKNSKWEEILRKIEDPNPASWRVAIIEADILLDETLTSVGYVGATIGEKLKSANTQSFTTVQDAWSAHKVRNDIAHVGSDFVLTRKVAQETIIQFGRVFREFGVI